MTCSPDGDMQNNYHLSKISSEKVELRGNMTLKVPFDDDFSVSIFAEYMNKNCDKNYRLEITFHRNTWENFRNYFRKNIFFKNIVSSIGYFFLSILRNLAYVDINVKIRNSICAQNTSYQSIKHSFENADLIVDEHHDVR